MACSSMPNLSAIPPSHKRSVLHTGHGQFRAHGMFGCVCVITTDPHGWETMAHLRHDRLHAGHGVHWLVQRPGGESAPHSPVAVKVWPDRSQPGSPGQYSWQGGSTPISWTRGSYLVFSCLSVSPKPASI
eukprot:scaffold66958_cov22-Tisochrysis_lutea.AAC.1